MSGVISSIKDALPSFEDEDQEWFRNHQLNTNASENHKPDVESINFSDKSNKSFGLLPDFLTVSNATTPVVSQQVDVGDAAAHNETLFMEQTSQKLPFRFLAAESEV